MHTLTHNYSFGGRVFPTSGKEPTHNIGDVRDSGSIAESEDSLEEGTITHPVFLAG